MQIHKTILWIQDTSYNDTHLSYLGGGAMYKNVNLEEVCFQQKLFPFPDISLILTFIIFLSKIP